MEQSLSSLAFRGSIVEAIAEAKLHKKLFVVYIAGDNPESKLLETSTWLDKKVSETLSKYCILLHILEGSSEALNFSAIYPHHSAPCITAIGYNGVQLWQKEGFVSADVLASNLEKEWLSLHVRETTVAFLTAALTSGTSETASSEQVIPLTDVSTQSTGGDLISSDVGQPLYSEEIEDLNDNENPFKDGVCSPESSLANVFNNGEFDQSMSKIDTESTSNDHFDSQNDPKVSYPIPQENSDQSGSRIEVSRDVINEVSEVTLVNTADASDSSAVVLLNIRLPDGSTLQVKFSVMDTLKMVKDYINENRTSNLGFFSIAIPYPRKVFNDQDLDSTLSELGLFNRQALIVVPHNEKKSPNRGGSSVKQTHSSNDASSSNRSEGYYWEFIRKMLSYVDPFSYLNRTPTSPSSADESQNGVSQYGSNASLENTQRNGRVRPNSSTISSNRDTSPTSSKIKNRQQTSRFGANIHTLKHDDDDDSRSRNVFWNGNSTQFGGNDDGPK